MITITMIIFQIITTRVGTPINTTLSVQIPVSIEEFINIDENVSPHGHFSENEMIESILAERYYLLYEKIIVFVYIYIT